MQCPKCGASKAWKDGKPGGKQRYKCRRCKKSFFISSAKLKSYGDNEHDIDKESIKQEIHSDFKKDNAYITIKSLNIRTEEDAIKAANIDLDIWRVERCKINSWEVTMKIKKPEVRKINGKEKIITKQTPEKYTNFQVTLFLKRKIAQPLEEAIKGILQTIKTYSPKYPTLSYKNSDIHILQEIALFDHHFGKLAWHQETRENYDLKIAKQRFLDGIHELLDRTQNYKVERILFPMGNDLLHIDNDKGMTYSGTQMDYDCRLAKIIHVAFESIVEAMELCVQRAPIDIMWIPGNHDVQTSFYLCKMLWAWFHNHEHVNVDANATFRKYYEWGITLLGFTHGSEEKHQSLPLIMASEEKDAWARTKYHEWHIGHFHRKKEEKFGMIDTYNSVMIRTLPSLSATDHWHYKKGFVGTPKSAECYMYDKLNGPIGSHTTNGIELPGIK